jgi:hypothetical protein
VSDIRIYIEGGGDKFGKAQLRAAFSQFLGEIRTAAYQKRMQLRLVLCGSREDTFDAFRRGVQDHPADHVLLLVDADRSIDGTPREHLGGGETRWDLSFADDGQCHLMAEVMESWFLADPATLEKFYGQDFAAGRLPKRTNVEEVPKDEVFSALSDATRKTGKGRYHKIQHGPQILERLDTDRVSARAPHCAKLFDALRKRVA